jgi:hypothetical protein
MQIIEIRLEPSQFRIMGPPELVLWISVLQRTTATDEDKHTSYMNKLSNYYVNCSVSGDKIAVSKLKYWNVDLQECYKDAEAALDQYTTCST